MGNINLFVFEEDNERDIERHDRANSKALFVFLSQSLWTRSIRGKRIVLFSNFSFFGLVSAKYGLVDGFETFCFHIVFVKENVCI